MKMRRIDRSGCKSDFASKLLGEADKCRDNPDKTESHRSSIKMHHYDQQHCSHSKGIKVFEQTHNCSVYPLYGTFDLDPIYPLCNRSNLKLLMKSMNGIMKNNSSLLDCLPACVEEIVDTDISFTLLSGEQVDSTSDVWMLGELNKEDVILMEVFFSSSNIEVKN